jgi:hypothetical protein
MQDQRKTRWSVALLAVTALGAMLANCSASGRDEQFGMTGAGGAASAASGGGAPGTGTLTGVAGTTGAGGLALSGATGSGGAPNQGGPTTCDSSCQAAGGTCNAGTCTLAENPGMVPAATQTQLEAGGNADPSFGFVYPYDRTVFPRGLLPPTLQFQGSGSPDAMFVHISFPGLDYQGFFGPSNPANLKLSAAMWSAVTLAATGTDAVKVQVTAITAGKVSGPVTETWTIAPGNLSGTIYYETYLSPLVTAAGGLGGVGIMKIQPGASTPTVFASGCGNVCHTASADGSTLVSATGFIGASVSYDLTNNGAVILEQPNETFTYGGIYPDGSFLMSATDYRTWLPLESSLYDTKTGAIMSAPGWDGVITDAATPAFSPDGKLFAFNHEDTGAGHTIGLMSFDVTTKTFSGLADIASDPNDYLGWPAFTPDTKWVVYHAGSNENFETDSGAVGDLYFTDVATHTVARLDALDGYENGTVYLPANDAHLNFAPTVLPAAVGGYFWVVFTSHRSYGNELPSMDNCDENGKLWVAAFDLSPTPGQDASHPAFFLDGQETEADNLRGYWVLPPCQQLGTDCVSGDQCCQGFCRQGDAGAMVCVPPPAGGCSNVLEKCATAANCCIAGYQCINGLCAQPAAE